MEFRKELWNLCGFEGDLHELYERSFPITEEQRTHPLFPLFDHSDCDGELTPAECQQMIPTLRELMPKLKWDYNRTQTGRLIRGMEMCVAKNITLEFR
jgi:hypothetical protein